MAEQNLKSPASFNSLIIIFFKENLPQFTLNKETLHGPYWGVSFIEQNGTEVKVRGENDGFDIIVNIQNEEFLLWKFDKSVISAAEASDKNILYQLSVLVSFLKRQLKLS
jgi:hypothetical protein